MHIETFHWLLTHEGQQLLERATQAYVNAGGDAMRAITRLRKECLTTEDRTASAMTQVGLRAKAVDKFGVDAARMYFTPDGLEQATRQRVAEHRAARLAAAEVATVIDLTCGIGGDLIALSRAGLTSAGVDLDAVRVAIAQANLDALGLAGAVQQADATQLNVSGFGAAFLDPARRSGKGRLFDVHSWTPPWPFVQDLLAGRAVAKVAPGIPHSLIPEGVEAEWVSERGEVKEAALWSPYLATSRRRATVIGIGGLATLTEEDDPYAGEPRPVRALGRCIYEPDGAVIRAGLVTAVAAGVGGGLLDSHIAYVTSDEAFRSPFASSYEVRETLPYREKQLKAALRQRGIGRLTIKKRGVDIAPEQLRKRLELAGENEATLILTRVAGVGTALLVRPF